VQREREREASFQHTQLGTYLAGAFGLMYLWASSAQVRAPISDQVTSIVVHVPSHVAASMLAEVSVPVAACSS
jgi:hypothetical protein